MIDKITILWITRSIRVPACPLLKGHTCTCAQGRVGQVAVAKNLPASAADTCSIPRPGGSPGGGHGYPLQCSCQENPTDRGAWRATVHGVAKSQTRLSNEAHCCADNRVSSPGSPASGETVLRASLSRGEHRHTHVDGGRTNGGRAGTAAA